MSRSIILKTAIALLTVYALLSCSSSKTAPCAAEGRIFVNGKPHSFIGTNLWYAGRLASSEEGLERLRSELDFLKGCGVDNLRVLAVEGEDIDALRTALDEMAERGMYAVLFMNNAWEWSYGFADYLEAAGEGRQPRPSTDGYSAYMNAMSAFCMSEAAIRLNHQYITSTVSALKDHDAIFSWQISNEPRCFSSRAEVKDAFVNYIHSTAALIKSIDPVHMVSTGNEGVMGCEEDIELCRRINDCDDIDYVTIHIWPYNWGWVREDSLDSKVDEAIARTDIYIDAHLSMAEKLGKAVVIEEFGYPRDGFSFKKGSSVSGRDRYYAHVFNRIIASAEGDGRLAGCNFWGWGGQASQNPDSIWWQEGDDYCGDPAQEQQGLNSVYSDDMTTIETIRAANSRLSTYVHHTNQVIAKINEK